MPMLTVDHYEKFEGIEEAHMLPELGLEHNPSPTCWCVPTLRWTDRVGKRMARPIYIHKIYTKRGNA